MRLDYTEIGRYVGEGREVGWVLPGGWMQMHPIGTFSGAADGTG